MLFQLETFIKREKIVSTQQLTREFSLDLQALLPMLARFEYKGVIAKCPTPQGCRSKCFKCGDGQDVAYYEYLKK